jgi:hypothetical protein
VQVKEVVLADKTASSEFVRILSTLTAQSESSYLVIFAPGGPIVKSEDATFRFSVLGSRFKVSWPDYLKS